MKTRSVPLGRIGRSRWLQLGASHYVQPTQALDDKIARLEHLIVSHQASLAGLRARRQELLAQLAQEMAEDREVP